MNDAELDELLRAVPEDAGAERGHDDARLLELAAGAEDEALEAELAEDPEGRALLASLSEPVPAGIREAASRALPARTKTPWGRRWLPAAAALAAAAAIGLFVWPSGAPAPQPYLVDGPLGGVREVRGDDAPSAEFVATSQLRVVARPERPVEGPAPVMRVFATRGGAIREAPRSAFEAGTDGAVRFEIRAGELLDADGDWELHVLLVPPEDSDTEVRRAADLASVPSVDRHVLPLRFVRHAAEAEGTH